MFRDVDTHRATVPDWVPPLPNREQPGTEADRDSPFIRRRPRIFGVYVRPDMADVSPRSIRSTYFVNAAGPWAGDVARLSGIGVDKTGVLAVPLPVVKRCVRARLSTTRAVQKTLCVRCALPRRTWPRHAIPD